MSHSSRLRVVCGPMFSGKTTKLVESVRRALVDSDTYHSVFVLKPSLDTREGIGVPPVIRTHDGDEVRDGGQTSMMAPLSSSSSSSLQISHINPLVASLGLSERVMVCPVDAPEWIIGRLPVCVDGKRVFLGVDEAQFFSSGWVEVMLESLLSLRGDVDLVFVGLDLDRDGVEFPGMGVLLRHCLSVGVEAERLVGVCSVCGERNAERTFWRGIAAKKQQGAHDGEVGQVLIGGSEQYEPRCYVHWLEGRSCNVQQ